jgi:hypothetical protein
MFIGPKYDLIYVKILPEKWEGPDIMVFLSSLCPQRATRTKSKRNWSPLKNLLKLENGEQVWNLVLRL